jgi:type IV fimbrial biogenesis protein FimT
MVTVAIMAILAAVAAPSFNEAILGSKLTGYANNFVASATLARSEAIKRNAAVTLCIAATDTSTTCTTSGDWEQGWIVLSGTTVIQRQQALPSGYRLVEQTSTSIKSIAFQAVGAGATLATLKLCRATPSIGAQDREIQVSLTGRVSVTKTNTGTCT